MRLSPLLPVRVPFLPFPEFACALYGLRCHFVAFWAGDGDRHAGKNRREYEGSTDIVSVPHPSDGEIPGIAEMLPDCQDIGEELAGVLAVGKAVDDRDRGISGQFFDRTCAGRPVSSHRTRSGTQPVRYPGSPPPPDLEIFCI